MTLKLKAGKKSVVILPKAIRENVGIDEGDNVVVELGDGITLRPEMKADLEQLRAAFRITTRGLPGSSPERRSPAN